jgi:hypothetical protein
MKARRNICGWLLGVVGVLAVGTGCESTGGGTSVSGGMYYGVGIHDPWYYGGHYYDDPDIIVVPPERPERPPERPVPPIAKPPPPTRPQPMPSIPSTPRPMPRARGR